MKTGFALILLTIVFFGSTAFMPDPEANLVNDILNQTNRFRRSKGLPALIIKKELNSIARKHSIDMAKARVQFGHTGFDRRDAMARKKISGVHRFAENVAYGATSGIEVVNMWKRSANHRKNMLGRYRYIGIGIAKDKRGRIYYTQVFAG